ncbi:hypothetical protein [Brevundimonas sp. Root1279]|uniref:hypothetical protein n=1 Tax=Brevundimonas sp. Root1279 TaxID=1736443 RepID=UPI0006F7E51F|nr:hypothetical protein [Brevundimonas sp. Root1279]KQW82230.1 hypothetical protein ASC65_08090 [Brevundimonas sp. Root1279]
MDIATHSITLISIIVGLGLTEMFGNLHRLIRLRDRVRWDALPLAWVAALFCLTLNYWWALYLGLDGSDRARTAAQFALVLAPPILLFVTMASVLPGADLDMRHHYDEEREVFLLTFALYQVSTWATALITGVAGWNAATIARTAILGLLVAMLMTRSRRFDWVGLLIILGILVWRLMTQVVR